jgi:hypothetical protein
MRLFRKRIYPINLLIIGIAAVIVAMAGAMLPVA